ncbi:MAG: type II toxin-antitoxin system HicA family toxin [Synergistaceae bacterium]|nr:type II toxin-antitoxin system HicA family toxin [Synergistaceae bacterium]
MCDNIFNLKLIFKQGGEALWYSELERLLKSYGCYPLGKGTKHDKWRSPINGHNFLIPRHQGKEVPVGTLNDILKDAGIKK